MKIPIGSIGLVDLPTPNAQRMVYLPTYTINLGPTVGKYSTH